MKYEEMKALYASNKNFKEYVEKYTEKYQKGGKISISEALEHKIVNEVAKHYLNDMRENL